MAAAKGLVGMRIGMLCEGSRGDCQPYVALAHRLVAKGAVVKFMTNVDHEKLVKGQGLDFEGTFSDCQAILKDNKALQESMRTGNVYTFIDGVNDLDERDFPTCLSKAWAVMEAFKPEVLLHGALSMVIAGVYSILHDIPAVPCMLAAAVCLPTGESAPMGMPSTAAFVNRWLWRQLFYAMNETSNKKMAMCKTVLDRNDWEEKCMLMTVDEAIDATLYPLTPYMIGCNAQVNGPPSDVTCPLIEATGWWTLDSSNQVARFEAGDPCFGGADKPLIDAFLGDGAPPVYIGWGSMIAVSAEFMTKLAVETLKKSGRRGIVLKGWSMLGPDLLKKEDADLKAYAKENILFVTSAPHEWLLPKCALSIIHGGSGTTAAAMRSGKPTIITPIWLDQYDFAKAVTRLGVGVATCTFKCVTPDVLSTALEKCFNDKGIGERAATLGETLRNEDGVGRAVDILNDFVEGPLRSGTWLASSKLRQARRKANRNKFMFGACC